jgi:hypothetical protein
MTQQKTWLVPMCRVCRYVSFGLRDTRHFYVSFVSHPFRGDTRDTSPTRGIA